MPCQGYFEKPPQPLDILRARVYNNILYTMPDFVLCVFVYSKNPRVYTYVNADAICVYNASESDAVIHVPIDGIYIDEITGDVFIATDGTLILSIRDLRAYLLMRNI